MLTRRQVRLPTIGSILGRRRFGSAFGGGPLRRSARSTRFKGFGSFTRTLTRRKKTRSGQGVTQQHDARRIYVKSRMGRFQRRRWKTFKNKVNAVAEKDLGSRTLLFNLSTLFSNATANSQGIAYVSLYSGNSGDSWQADLSTLGALENSGNPTAAAGGTVYDTSKFIFKSAVLDVTFTNVSVLNNLEDEERASEAKLEVDVYECISGREWSDSQGVIQNLPAAFAIGATQTLNIGGGGTALALSSRGATPFDLPAALGYYRIKILKKTKYFVNNSDTFTYQMRDPKRRVMMQDRMDKLQGANIPGWTKHLLIVFKLVPGLTVGTSDGQYEERLQVGITRKYFYKLEGEPDDRDRYLPNT